MPKRVGYVYEEVVDLANCEQAVLDAIRRKKKNPYILYVKEHYKEFGYKVQQSILNGWNPQEPRQKVINEGTGKKKRELKIPCLHDHFVHTAVARVLSKYLPKRFDFYACGSLPKRGQTFATMALKGNLQKKKPKYCAIADVRQFYKSTKKDVVMRCLNRVFKDKRFLQLNEQILNQMGDGLAIGFTVSHWYAQLVMSFVDFAIRCRFKDVWFTRFMDNYVFTCGRKRTLHNVVNMIKERLASFALTIKQDWQVFPIKKRMIEFLSYRFNHDKVILRKALMIRMSRFYKHMTMSAHSARTVMSYQGITKHCNSYRFRKERIYPFVSISECRRLISNAGKKRTLLGTS